MDDYRGDGTAPSGSADEGLGQQVGQAATVVADKAQELGAQVADKAQEVGGKAGKQFRDQLDRRSTEAGHQLDMTSAALHKSADELRANGSDLPARVTTEIADRADGLASYLRTNDANAILADIERYGRSQPWAVVAGGIALGFLGSRFLKASSSRRYESSPRDGRAVPPTGGDTASLAIPVTTPPPVATPPSPPLAPTFPPVTAPPAEPPATAWTNPQDGLR